MCVTMFYKFLDSCFYVFVWPFYKWLLHQLTGQCELLRVTNEPPLPRANKTLSIESSLKHSKLPALKRLLVDDNVNIDEAVVHIMRLKAINPEAHPRFSDTLHVCLSQICGYRQLVAEVEGVRRVQYSSDNLDHEELLMRLWLLLKPDTKLKSRISSQWTEVGFQGDDPMTDFRGMGLLGLHNLLFFVSRYRDQARAMLARSFHPQYGYSFAIVGINLTSLAYSVLTCGHFKTHFYNKVQGCPRLNDFHELYCYLFVEFDKFWFDERPRDIMEFNRVKTKFQKQLIHKLKNKSTVLCVNKSNPC